MVQQTLWTDRKFEFNFPVGIFPCIIERYRGTPARLEEITKPLSRDICIKRFNDAWSIQEHAGHLLDLEELTGLRIADFVDRKEVLTAADITNRKTTEANYNKGSIQDILQKFRKVRTGFTDQLEQFDEEVVSRVALHPRLQTPMRLIDMVYFMCEHDDYHLARIRGLIRLSNV